MHEIDLGNFCRNAEDHGYDMYSGRDCEVSDVDPVEVLEAWLRFVDVYRWFTISNECRHADEQYIDVEWA